MLFSQKSFARLLFGISEREAEFSTRGFTSVNIQAKDQLELSARTFISGYNAALQDARFDVLVSCLQKVDEGLRGFAFEGAAMGLAILDYLSPWKHRLQSFLGGPGAAHTYMLYVGAGWTLGILPQSPVRVLKRADPIIGWLTLDGYGFQQGFFKWQRCIQQQKQPSHLHGYARRAFDQGLGRSLWFVKGADVTQIAHTIRTFSTTRQADLWSGIGLACSYAGGTNMQALEALIHESDNFYPHLAQGTAFAVKARQKAGNLLTYTGQACQTICGADLQTIIDLVDSSFNDLSLDESAYEVWRSRIRAYFTTSKKINQLSTLSMDTV